jgi:hypothetical protein
MKIFVVLTIVIFQIQTLHGQEKLVNPSRISVKALESHFAIFWSNGALITFDDLSQIALNNDFFDFNSTGFQMSRSSSDFQNTSFSLGINLSFCNLEKMKFKSSPALRISISHHSGFYSAVRFEKRDQVTVDSISVTYQGVTNQYPVDSVHIESHNFSATSNRIRLNSSIIWTTQPFERVAFYAGAGFGFGAGINSRVQYEYLTRYEINSAIPLSQTSQQNPFLYSNTDPILTLKEYKTPNLFDFNVFSPIGATFTLSKNHHFLKNLVLFVETAPGILFSTYAKRKNTIHTGVNAVLGARIEL